MVRQINQPLIEESFAALATLSDDKRVAKSKSMIAKYDSLSQDANGHAMTKWNVPSQSNAKDYVTHVGIIVENGLFALAKGKWKPKEYSNALANADVKVHCNCPDFYWGGAKYNLSHLNGKNSTYPISSGYKYEKNVVTHAPDVRDPDRRHKLCKHLLAVFNVFKNNVFSIMGDARKFDIDIKPTSVDVADEQGQPTTPQMETLKSKETDILLGDVVTQINQLHKDQKLPDDEVNEIIDQVITTNTDDSDEIESTTIEDQEGTTGDINDETQLSKDVGDIADPQDILKQSDNVDSENNVDVDITEDSDLIDDTEEDITLTKDTSKLDVDSRELLN